MLPQRPAPRRPSVAERIEEDASSVTKLTSVLPAATLAPVRAMTERTMPSHAPRFDKKNTGLLAKFQMLQHHQPDKLRPNSPTFKESTLSLQRNMAALTSFNLKEKQSVQVLKQQLEQTQVEIESLKIELGLAKGESKRLSDELHVDKTSTAHAIIQANQKRQSDVDKKQLEDNHQVEIFKWENRCQEISANHKQLAKLLARAQDNERVLTRKAADAAEHVTALETTVAALRLELQTIARAKLAEDDTLKARAENEALRCKVVALNQSLDDVHAKERDARNTLTIKTMQFAQEKDALLREISHVRDEWTAARAHGQLEHDKLTAIIARDEKHKADLESQVVDLTDKCIALDEAASSVRKQLDFQVKVIDDKQLALDQTKALAAQHERDVERLMREIAALDGENATMREKLIMVSDVWAACTSQNPTVQALQQGRQGQNEALAIVLDEKERLKAEVVKAKEEVAKLTAQLAKGAPSGDVVALQTQLASMLNKKNELLLMMDQMKAELTTLTTSHTTLRIAHDTLLQRCAALEEVAMDPSVIIMLKQAQLDLTDTVNKLVEAETSSETAFTCLKCMSIFVRPVTLTGCGHTYCESCLYSTRGSGVGHACKECGAWSSSDGLFHNNALADLASRFVYRQQTLSSLTGVCQSLEDAFAAPTVALVVGGTGKT
ncbi:hypothetical protein, variant [Aphanomyces invadans]|uniref:RING-type domain-containing protein n=1 Tax=Aphanomyces invadans TaxID=157072 RepID=A0A024TNM2_9STRA|nr:hypothetical protein, variant [Aphanomyces invadans]ETV95628.1 hypothetical protein, variant [Aphanomyces invadans]|eukprot:XP_008875821.1 hypothetical protein, variant [Aphanomyces invadans]